MKCPFSPILQVVSLSFALLSTPAQSTEMTRDEILARADDMAMEMFEHQRWNFPGRRWTAGVAWVGIADLSEVNGNPKIMEALVKMGDRKLQIGPRDEQIHYDKWALIHHELEKEPHHADDMVIGESFIHVFQETGNPKILENIQQRVDEASTAILSEEMARKAEKATELGWNEALTWYWCDALFMAAPLHARLSAVTGEPKFRNAMHTEWKRTQALLYDTEEHLYYRDKNFIGRSSKNGQKIFWARGNGWVIAALARVLNHLPADDVERPHYIAHFKEMAEKLASLQQADGTWSPSLLDYEHFPFSELSGTGLICYGLAWGINQGILDDQTYRPTVAKAWAALLKGCEATKQGYLGYIQPVGAEPSRIKPEHYVWFGNGIFMMAAVQVAKMAPIQIPEIPALRPEPTEEK